MRLNYNVKHYLFNDYIVIKLAKNKKVFYAICYKYLNKLCQNGILHNLNYSKPQLVFSHNIGKVSKMVGNLLDALYLSSRGGPRWLEGWG